MYSDGKHRVSCRVCDGHHILQVGQCPLCCVQDVWGGRRQDCLHSNDQRRMSCALRGGFNVERFGQ